MGRRAEREVVAIAFVTGRATENVALLPDHILAHAIEERFKSRLIACRASLVAFRLRKTFRREAHADERVRAAPAIAPQASGLAGGDMIAFAGRRLPCTQAGIVATNLDNPGTIGIDRSDPVEPVAAEIEDPTAAKRVILERRERLAGPVFGVRS